MDLAESDLLFIDVDASTPAVKQEREDIPAETDEHTKKKSVSENHFKCNSCQYITYHRFLFQEHINRHKGIKPYKCELCPYSSVSKKYAKMHQDKHKTCPCGYLSRNALQLKRHVAKCGNKPPDDTESQRCTTCNKEYVDGKALAKHRANLQMCAVCSLECCSNSALKTHMLKEHSIQTEPRKERFQCGLCSWSSSKQQKILLHLIHHPQAVDPDIVDVTVLRRFAILPPE